MPFSTYSVSQSKLTFLASFGVHPWHAIFEETRAEMNSARKNKRNSHLKHLNRTSDAREPVFCLFVKSKNSLEDDDDDGDDGDDDEDEPKRQFEDWSYEEEEEEEEEEEDEEETRGDCLMVPCCMIVLIVHGF